MRQATLLFATAIFLVFGCGPASAETMQPPTEDYLRRFKRDAPFLAVIEYVDKDYQRVIGQRTFRSQKPFGAGDGVTIPLQGLTLNLYGLSACQSDQVISVYIYRGPCSQAGQQYLGTELKLSPLLLCRVFVSQANKPVQDATCFTLYKVLDAEIVHNVEAAILKVGAVKLSRDTDGKPLRPDLLAAEDYAREKQTLLWNPELAKMPGDEE